MATRAFLIHTTTKILTLPLMAISNFIFFLKPRSLNRDLQRCLYVVDSASDLPNRFVTTLVAAEDHRNAIHPGVDPIAILRVLSLRIQFGYVQGASTIEQQLVRVVLNRYEKTIRRKLYEQVLAIMLSSKRSKERIAISYLTIAFYGSGQYGIKALKRFCGSNLDAATQESVSQMIAKLKYPQPLFPSQEWRWKVHRRVIYIDHRIRKLANQRFHKEHLRRVSVFGRLFG